jgi:hypothetical protein
MAASNHIFALQIEEFARLTIERAEQVTRMLAIQAAQQIVQRSPVGNPDGWKANAGASAARQGFNPAVDASNAQGGQRKRRKGVKALRRDFPNVAGNGYTGGRFRANWQIGIGAVNAATTEDVDASGNSSIRRATAGVNRWRAGQTIYFSNSLPYARRLEYEGWSRQAPNGMVRVTVLQMNDFLRNAIAAVQGGA